MQAMYHEIDQLMAKTSQQCHAMICYGTIGWNDTNERNDHNQNNNDETERQYFIIQKENFRKLKMLNKPWKK